MYLGKYNSSLTRVQPIFTALSDKDESGATWLDTLLGMGGTHPDATVGHLVSAPRFEYLVAPPKSLLRWLILNPKEWNRSWRDAEMSSGVRKDRDALVGGQLNATTALSAIEAAGEDPSEYRGWWCLEGPSHVDCALFTEGAVIFIEGKRTELGPSESTTFMSKRNQVVRNADCARDYALSRGLDYYAMLIIEGGDEGRAARACSVRDSIARSLPHRTEDQRVEIARHYLGFTTWQEIGKMFGVQIPT
jgi:hypothetical protein